MPLLSPVTSYGWARLSPEGDDLLARFCLGRAVVDIGAGSGGLSARMMALGASSVMAIEKDEMEPIPGVAHERRLFSQIEPDSLPKHALLSWPVGSVDCGSVDAVGTYLAFCAEEVLYIGQNDLFTVCGWLELWQELSFREVLASVDVPDHNTIIHYGRRLEEARTMDLLLPEELTALAMAKKYAHRFRSLD